MSRKFTIAAITLLVSTSLAAQQTQTSEAGQTQVGQPAQPTPSVYNRMRRIRPQADSQNQQPTTQSQQFPSPGQFPPEQQGAGMPGQSPSTQFPHATAPPQAQQQNGQFTGLNPVPSAKPPVQQPPQPVIGQALRPTNPPSISFANGEMTVKADNSSMSEILSGIERATGAHLEGTQPDSERVFGTFGPGTPREVLSSLLTGSRYDFILLDAIEDPGKLQRIILSQHGAASGNVAAGNQPRPTPGTEASAEDEEVTPPQPVPEPQTVAQPSPPEPQQQQSPGTQQVKTPEQLLQELQRLRQQQQAGQEPSSPR